MPNFIARMRGIPFTLCIAAYCLMQVNLTHAEVYQSTMQLDAKHSVAQYIACLDARNVALVSAHRGGIHTGFPENALESLQEAVSYGPMLLEVDVRETKDGELVLLHDSTLERTTTGQGDLSSYTLSQLKDIRLIDSDGKLTAFSIPTLKEVLNWADDRAIVQLDVKRGVDIAKVAKAVVDAEAVDSTLLIAYQIDDAKNALSVDKNLSFSLSINSIEDLNTLEEAGVPVRQIVAWTGVVSDSEKSVWPVLEQRNIPAAAGALWTLEDQIIESGDPQPYIDIAQAGVDVIAADYYRLAFDTLASQQDLAAGLVACKGQ